MPVSAEQRHSIRSLLAQGLDNQEIAAQIGVSPGTVAAVKAHMTMGTYGGGDGAPDAEAEVASAGDTAFGLERDLQLALRRSIEQLEPGLSIIGIGIAGLERLLLRGALSPRTGDRE